ncbi:MAG: purine-nucleoside phosphorylase [Saprospiraceae bacterium]|nr:purine-nucleoside phosphorylase [Saprospiraceae bacterium]
MGVIAEKADLTTEYLRNRGVGTVDIAMVLGTGLSGIETMLKDKLIIDYSDIPLFPISTVEGHSGKLIYGRLGNKNLLLLSGRFHYYEGYGMEEVTYYIHVMATLGAKNLVMTNAAGGLNPRYHAGDLVLVRDHINLFPANPLRGTYDAELGPRFPDMLHAYPVTLRNSMKNTAAAMGIKLHEGVYLGWQGPSLETPAEYKMARMLGADLVGMSTVPEVIVAKYRNLDVLVLSIVSNICFPPSALKETTIEEVVKVMEASTEKVMRLLTAWIDSQE